MGMQTLPIRVALNRPATRCFTCKGEIPDGMPHLEIDYDDLALPICRKCLAWAQAVIQEHDAECRPERRALQSLFARE